MSRANVEKDYFEWMYDLVCGGRFREPNSYRKLFTHLHSIEFTYNSRIKSDADRAIDGVDLRRRFALQNEQYYYDYVRRSLDDPCSILEMMIGLAIRMEETIMADPQKGDRTGQWFWKMMNNLGLGFMVDYRYDEKYVNDAVNKFLKHKYDTDGRGGLFIVKNCDADLRKLSIWRQMCLYLDTIM